MGYSGGKPGRRLYLGRFEGHITPMAILKIARMGHPVLGRPAEPVADPTAPEILRLVVDMAETLADADGAGLAAPQVHVPLRVVMFRLPRERENDEPDENEDPLTILINPEIEPLSDETALGWEGCLSLPGMLGEVSRHVQIRYRGLGIDGAPVEREASGYHARLVQHECDHLDGILYPMRMDDLSRFGFVEEMRRLAAEDEIDDEGGDESEEVAPRKSAAAAEA